jgi:tetratricopeptide (TPR) repeat protein
MSNEVVLMDNRQLIPRWHTSRKAMSLQFPSMKNTKNKAADYLEDHNLKIARDSWDFEKNYVNAIELYTALMVRGIHADPDGDDSLNYLLKMGIDLPKGAVDLIALETRHIDKSHNYYTYNPEQVNVIISRLRSIVRKFPSDYMTWSDMGFYYTVLGLTDKALKCLEIAWHLCNSHPYIARTYARFLIHKGEPEQAMWLLKKSGGIYHEPLITSAAIAISGAFNVASIDIAKSRNLLGTYNGFKAYASELYASIGTLEFNNGKKKKAKEYFKQALIIPSENAMSQYKWLNHKTGFSLDEEFTQNISTVEGNVNQLYVQGEFEKCRDKLLELFSFQPISDGPIADAGYMSIVCLNDPDFVIKLSEGRIPKTHMSFGELNNLTVAKLMKNDLDSAEVNLRLLAKKIVSESSDSKGVYLATSGLLMFKLGRVEDAKELYSKAIKHFDAIKQNRSAALAEHFLSLNLKSIEDPEYETVRKRVEKKAKELKMREIELKPEILITKTPSAPR